MVAGQEIESCFTAYETADVTRRPACFMVLVLGFEPR